MRNNIQAVSGLHRNKAKRNTKGAATARPYLYYPVAGLLLLLVMNFTGCTALDYTISAKNAYERGLYDDAVASGLKAAKGLPSYAPAWYWLGLSQLAKNQYYDALRSFQMVVNITGGRQAFDSHFQIACIHYKMEDWDKVISNATGALGLYKVNKHVEEYWNAKKDLGKIYAYLGWAYYHNGNYDKAINAFYNGLGHYCDDSDFDVPKESPPWVSQSCYCGRGFCYLKRMDYLAALSEFERALKIEPVHKTYLIKCLVGKGEVNFYQGKYAQALKCFNQAMENAPDNEVLCTIYKDKAFTYMGLGDKETALSLIKKAGEIDKNYEADKDLALLYYAAGDKQTAWKYRGGSGCAGVMIKPCQKGSANGVQITGFSENSPAQKAGLFAGDIITKIDNDPVSSVSGFVQKTKALVPGTTVSLTIIREEMEKTVSLQAGSAEPIMESDPLIANLTARSAWKTLPSGTSNNLTSAYFTDANTGYAVGGKGTIVKTTNGGESWSALPSGTSNGLFSVHFTDANTGYAAGDKGTIVKTTNGGESWSALPSGTSNSLHSVCFTDANTGYAAGDKGAILKTINGGASWTIQTPDTSVWLSSVFFADVNTGYAAGTNAGKKNVFKTSDGGAHWTAQMTSGAMEIFTSIVFTDPHTGYLVGDEGLIEKTVNGGADWIIQSSGLAEWINSVCFTDARTGYAVGSDGVILKTTDGGSNWVINQTPGASYNLDDVFFPDAKTGYAVGSNGTILKMK